MTDILPTRAELAAEPDPSKRLLALVEPATNMLIRATALNEVNEIRSRAAALERYARSIRLATEAIGAAQIIARRAEVRIGELDEKRSPPGKRSSFANDDLSRDERYDFRTMAEYPTVETVLGELAPEGKATRAAVLREIRRGEVKADFARERRRHEASPTAVLLDAERALRDAIKGITGQTLNAAPLAQRVKQLCRELGEML